MVIVKVELPTELDEQFKKKVFEVYGYKRGSISLALIDALKLWIEREINPVGVHDYVNYSEIRAKYPGKYIILKDNEVVLVKDTLEEIYTELSTMERKKYQLLTPQKHTIKRQKGRNLGWRMKRRQ